MKNRGRAGNGGERVRIASALRPAGASENTCGLTSLNPGSAAAAGRDASVTVSPTFAAWISLIPAMTNPTSPAASDSRATAFGVNTPTCSQL